MSSCLFALAVLFIGQVNAGNTHYDQYGASGQSAPPPAIDSADEATGGGLVDILEAPPQQSDGQGPASQSSRNAADPYGTTGAPLRGENQRNLQPSTSNTTLQPKTTAPPPGYEMQTQPAPTVRTPAAPSQSPGLKPSVMMRAMLTPPRDTRLTGQPTTLTEVVSGAASRAEQTQRVEAYWDLCSSVADYYLGLREQEELRRLRSVVPSLGPAGQQAEHELAVRIGTSQRAAVASQYRLASWIGPSAGLPLPVDVPHCGSYHTHFEQIFAGRPSAEAQELSALLPLRYAELKDAATAVTRAEEWLNLVAAARSDASDATGTLRALELLALRRRAFVQIVRDYNRRIARYSELATPGQIDAERLIGMLIRRNSASTATRPLVPAAPLNRQSQRGTSSAPSTFVEGWTPVSGSGRTSYGRDESVQPATAETPIGPYQERSLLVPNR